MRAATQFEHAEIVIAENTAQAEGSEEFDRVVDRVGFDPHVTDRHRRPAIFCDRFLLVSGLGGGDFLVLVSAFDILYLGKCALLTYLASVLGKTRVLGETLAVRRCVDRSARLQSGPTR